MGLCINVDMRVVDLWRLNASLLLLLYEKAVVTSFLDNHSKMRSGRELISTVQNHFIVLPSWSSASSKEKKCN